MKQHHWILGIALIAVQAILPISALAAGNLSPTASTSLKSLTLHLSDVQHVFGHSITDGGGRYSKTPAITCTQYPQTSTYTANFSGSGGAKGILLVIAQVYKFKSSAGPQCNQKYEIVQQKLLGNSYGKLTKVRSVGDAAFLLDIRTAVKGSPTVYSLSIAFTRGAYRAIIIVQSGKTIGPADVMKLGQVVDDRLRHNG